MRNATCRSGGSIPDDDDTPRGPTELDGCTVLCMQRDVFTSLVPARSIEWLKAKKYVSEMSNKDNKLVTSLEELELLAVIGIGTFGKVRLVKHKKSETAYALKSISKKIIYDLEQQEHIRSEKNILAELDHPFITKLIGTFRNPTHLFLLLEINSGGELFSYLVMKDYLCDEEARFFAGSIYLALEYLHQRNIAYRDLKPENIILNTEGFCRLVDFGFAKVLLPPPHIYILAPCPPRVIRPFRRR